MWVKRSPMASGVLRVSNKAPALSIRLVGAYDTRADAAWKSRINAPATVQVPRLQGLKWGTVKGGGAQINDS